MTIIPFSHCLLQKNTAYLCSKHHSLLCGVARSRGTGIGREVLVDAMCIDYVRVQISGAQAR